MAWAFVTGQTAAADSIVANTTATFPGNCTAGNRIIVMAVGHNQTLGAGAVTDGAGNTYTKDKTLADTALTDCAVYSANIGAGGGTAIAVTVASANVGQQVSVIITEYSGLSTATGASAVDQTAAATATGTTGSSGATPATTAANELVFGATHTRTNVAITAAGGATQRAAHPYPAAAARNMAVEDQDSGASSSTPTTSATFASAEYVQIAVVYKLAAAAGGGFVPKPLAYQILGARTGSPLTGLAFSTLQAQRIQARGWRPIPAVAAGVLDALAATATGVGNVTAALSVKHNLATGPTGVGAVTAALSVKHNLATTTTGVGATTAALSVTHRLVASPTGVGATTATLSVRHQLATVPIGVGRVTAALSVVHIDALAVVPTGVGRVTAALSVQHLLAATVVGVANASAALSGGSSAQVDGTRTGWYRRQLAQPPQPPAVVPAEVVHLAVRVKGAGVVTAALTVWSPTYTREELIAISHLVDADELAALMAI